MVALDSNRRSSLLPREHGAYAQLGITLLSGMLIGRPGARSIAQVVLTVAVFLASEPLMVLMGRRGLYSHSQALRRIILLGLVIAITGFLAWQVAPNPALRILAGPSLLACALFALFLGKREHTPLGECLTAWAMASASYPVARLSGADRSTALWLTFLLGGLLMQGMLLVRVQLQLHKGGLLRWVPLLLGALGLGLALQWLPWMAALAMLPVSLLSIYLHFSPIHGLKKLGWTLTMASALGATLAVVGLR